MNDLLPDDLTTDALVELTRLAREAQRRFASGRYLEAMASLSAMDPLKSMLVDQVSSRWYGAAGNDEAGDQPHEGGYL